jgi:hypothetical protein
MIILRHLEHGKRWMLVEPWLLCVGGHGRLVGDLVGRCRLEGGGLGAPPRKMERAGDLKTRDLRWLWIELFRIVGFRLAYSLGLVCRD